VRLRKFGSNLRQKMIYRTGSNFVHTRQSKIQASYTYLLSLRGATTLGITTLSITTLSITTLSISTLCRPLENGILRIITFSIKFRCAECRILSVILRVIMLSAVLLSVVMLCAIMVFITKLDVVASSLKIFFVKLFCALFTFWK
jgi:hypothetical protein